MTSGTWLICAVLCIPFMAGAAGAGVDDPVHSAGGSCRRPRASRECVCQRPLPDDLVALARELESAPTDDDLAADDTPPPSRGDPDRPAVGLRLVREQLERLEAAADQRTGPWLRRATDSVQEAWHHLAAGSDDLSHLGETTGALRQAEAFLAIAALFSRRAGRDGIERSTLIDRIQTDLAGLARRMAADLLRVAGGAGVSGPRLRVARALFGLGVLAAERNPGLAVGLFGGSLNLAADTITFDVALFEQNITAGLAGQTVGHAFSIAYLGQLYQGGESAGLARTAADPPSTGQSPGKKMHVASVSKTLTAIVTLRLLEENGLTPEAFIAPYLPSDWVLGDGVDQLRFRHFMTHTSGFGQINAGNDYAALRAAIATDVGSQSFSYQNANFGLMRVLAAGLQGIDPVDIPEIDPAALTAAAFLISANSFYAPIGVEIDCKPTDPTPTVQYRFPDTGMPGFVEPNHQLTCGGIGWFISSNELADVMTHLRNTTALLSPAARTAMQEGFLGFNDPKNYSWGDGAFGVYYVHGGDWMHGSGQLHACVAAFPIKVEAALVINSERGAIPYQCELLETAFDNAWVGN